MATTVTSKKFKNLTLIPLTFATSSSYAIKYNSREKAIKSANATPPKIRIVTTSSLLTDKIEPKR